jgi:heat shock protein HslJ
VTHRRPLTTRLALLIAIVGAVAACDVGEPPASLTRVSHPANLAGTTWRLLSVQGRPVPAGPDLTLAFDGDRISGNGGCNSFGGQVTYEPATGVLAVSGLLSTMRACAEAARNDVERVYLAALQGAAVANMDSAGHLVLTGSGAELVFEVGPRQVGAPAEASPTGSTAP